MCSSGGGSRRSSQQSGAPRVVYQQGNPAFSNISARGGGMDGAGRSGNQMGVGGGMGARGINSPFYQNRRLRTLINQQNQMPPRQTLLGA